MKSLLIFLLISSYVSYGQPSVLNYDILHKGDIIGGMRLNLQKDGEALSIKMNSKVEVKFIFSAIIKMQEESVYQKNKLIYSETIRTVNGSVKLNNQTKAAANFYYLTSKGKTTILRMPNINYNLLLLYFKEPDKLTEVYSDSFQRFIKIERLAAHYFKLRLPNNDFNEYYFENGVCTRVIVNSTLFTIEMRLKTS